MSGQPGITPQTIVIRDIETLDEMHEVEQLQREIWGVSDLDVLPALALRPQKEVGAILMGAFTGGRMVGFVFGFPGILNGETIIHSDMLGVRPEYRSQSLGYMLKLAQRDAALVTSSSCRASVRWASSIAVRAAPEIGWNCSACER